MFKDNLKNIRNEKNISQRELGRRIGKTGQYISYLESTEDGNPSLGVVLSIADALGVTTNDLTKGTSFKSATSEDVISQIDNANYLPDEKKEHLKKIMQPNLRLNQKPNYISEDKALSCTIDLIDYNGCDIALETSQIQEIKRAIGFTIKLKLEEIKIEIQSQN